MHVIAQPQECAIVNDRADNMSLPESKCRLHEICGREVDKDDDEGLCILHSNNPAKDVSAFSTALDSHQKTRGNDFTFIVFVGVIDFGRTVFSQEARFEGAIFKGEVRFDRAAFMEGASFEEATFNEVASFDETKFSKQVNFGKAKFLNQAHFSSVSFSSGANFTESNFFKGAVFDKARFSQGVALFNFSVFAGGAYFRGSIFEDEVQFNGAKFSDGGYFRLTTFCKDAHFVGARFIGRTYFDGTQFRGSLVNFSRCRFQAKVIFSSRHEDNQMIPVFEGTKVNFTQVVVEPPEALIFINTDFKLCRFLGTDLSKARFVGTMWPTIGHRFGLYDEVCLIKRQVGSWSQVERLYRELKQNHEDRRDYAQAGDFHYGEKQMQRKNPATPTSLRFFLTLYWLISGYGEKYLRPLVWASVLLIASAFGYLLAGIQPKGGTKLALTNPGDWLKTVHLSFRIMTLLDRNDYEFFGFGEIVNTIQRLLGPLLLGLFALAIRQRLKR